MGHECSHGSCSTSSSQSSGCSCSSKCGCGSNCGCGSKCGCSSNCLCGCQGKYSEQLLHLADQAWMELLKDKIKQEILANSGEQLTQLAKIVSDANQARWKEKMAAKKNIEDYETNLKNAMCCSQKK